MGPLAARLVERGHRLDRAARLGDARERCRVARREVDVAVALQTAPRARRCRPSRGGSSGPPATRDLHQPSSRSEARSTRRRARRTGAWRPRSRRGAAARARPGPRTRICVSPGSSDAPWRPAAGRRARARARGWSAARREAVRRRQRASATHAAEPAARRARAAPASEPTPSRPTTSAAAEAASQAAGRRAAPPARRPPPARSLARRAPASDLVDHDARVGDVVQAVLRIALEAAAQQAADRRRRRRRQRVEVDLGAEHRAPACRRRCRRRRACRRRASRRARRRTPRCRRACRPRTPSPAPAPCTPRCRGSPPAPSRPASASATPRAATPQPARRAAPAGSIAFASPKSRTLTFPSMEALTFCGLRSRWTIPFSCASSSASAIWRAMAKALI